MVENSDRTLFKGGLHSPQRRANQNAYNESTNLHSDFVIVSGSSPVRQVKGMSLVPGSIQGTCESESLVVYEFSSRKTPQPFLNPSLAKRVSTT